MSAAWKIKPHQLKHALNKIKIKHLQKLISVHLRRGGHSTRAEFHTYIYLE